MDQSASHPSLSRNPLVAGLAGASALTAVHQAARFLTPDAPRMDLIARKALRKGFKKSGMTSPSDRALFWMSFAGDIVANTLFYSAVGLGSSRASAWRGPLLGAAAGVGALVLPQRLGLGRRHQARTRQTMAMTVAWYLLGGLASAAVHRTLSKKES